MNAERGYLSSLVDSLIVAPAAAPGGVVAYAVRKRNDWIIEAGAAGVRSPSRPEAVTTRTVYDLASVTKPVIACAVARLVRHGRLRLDTPLEALLEEAKSTPAGPSSIELLLSHRAGLEAHRELFAPLREGDIPAPDAMLRAALFARRDDCVGAPPAGGFSPVYSDLGYLLLGVALERWESLPLDEIVVREVASPLAVELWSARHWRVRAKERFDLVAPTESVSFRGGEIAGVVHDENAFALAGEGLAGHAGLFGTADAVAGFGAAVLDALAGRKDDWLRSSDIAPLVRVRADGTLRAGFDGKSETGSSAGDQFGPRSFGHLGFTGTSLWCDPDADICVTLLTNRVCPTRDNVRIREIRPELHGGLHLRAAGRRADEAVRASVLPKRS